MHTLIYDIGCNALAEAVQRHTAKNTIYQFQGEVEVDLQSLT